MSGAVRIRLFHATGAIPAHISFRISWSSLQDVFSSLDVISSDMTHPAPFDLYILVTTSATLALSLILILQADLQHQILVGRFPKNFSLDSTDRFL